MKPELTARVKLGPNGKPVFAIRYGPKDLQSASIPLSQCSKLPGEEDFPRPIYLYLLRPAQNLFVLEGAVSTVPTRHQSSSTRTNNIVVFYLGHQQAGKRRPVWTRIVATKDVGDWALLNLRYGDHAIVKGVISHRMVYQGAAEARGRKIVLEAMEIEIVERNKL